MEFLPITRNLGDQESLLNIVVDQLNQMEDPNEKILKIAPGSVNDDLAIVESSKQLSSSNDGNSINDVISL
jgi:hypothetical protein